MENELKTMITEMIATITDPDLLDLIYRVILESMNLIK